MKSFEMRMPSRNPTMGATYNAVWGSAASIRQLFRPVDAASFEWAVYTALTFDEDPD